MSDEKEIRYFSDCCDVELDFINQRTIFCPCCEETCSMHPAEFDEFGKQIKPPKDDPNQLKLFDI